MTEPTWTDIAAENAIPEDDVLGLQVGERDVALYKVAGEVFATDNTCTHGQARLCDGFLDGYEIECPLHQGKFDVRTGRATCAPATDSVRVYPVRIMDGRVFAQI